MIFRGYSLKVPLEVRLRSPTTRNGVLSFWLLKNVIDTENRTIEPSLSILAFYHRAGFPDASITNLFLTRIDPLPGTCATRLAPPMPTTSCPSTRRPWFSLSRWLTSCWARGCPSKPRDQPPCLVLDQLSACFGPSSAIGAKSESSRRCQCRTNFDAKTIGRIVLMTVNFCGKTKFTYFCQNSFLQ